MSALLPMLAAAALTASGMASSDLPGLVRPDEYPADALEQGRSAAATIEISVDPNGRPIACRVAAVIGDAPLAEGICAIAMQKRYAAARLLSGTAAHARVTTMVRLWVPGSPDADRVAAARLAPDYDVHTAATPGAPPVTDVRMVLETNRKGAVTQCGARDDTQAELAEAICKVRTIFRASPMVDARGDAVPYVTEATVRVHAGG